MELGQLKEQNETLTRALKEQHQEVDRLKVCLKVFSFHQAVLLLAPNQAERVMNCILFLQESKEELAQVVSKLEQQQQNAREHEELTQNAKSMDESHTGQEVTVANQYPIWDYQRITTTIECIFSCF